MSAFFRPNFSFGRRICLGIDKLGRGEGFFFAMDAIAGPGAVTANKLAVFLFVLHHYDLALIQYLHHTDATGGSTEDPSVEILGFTTSIGHD